ncbi:D-glycerate dehydrogenase [Rossellomorea vietnamensis]|uniref:D-glycerate dehydrogenase n=1 Tax=Rossellomorea vietnamensis TaxID=218284 RepID=A0A5D4M9J5_9BACI|nr:D-glycerate dehydrogenase [Rossellomorea vietnamensis]TYR98107.1 D-glycerate dehydrogenase [Rossellomorea vietnamensis]
MKPYIYVTRKLPEQVLKPLQNLYKVHMWEDENSSVPREVLLEKAKKASGILSMLSDSIDKELFEQAPNLKVVANLAVGYDNIDLKAANEKGAAVCNTPDVLTDTTADLTFGLMMAAARRLIEADRYVREGKWKSWSPLLMAGMDIHQKTVGIIGMGSIGEAFAKRAKGFDMNILYHNRSRKPEAEETLGAKYADLDDLLSQSDFVVCLAPLTPETKGLLQREHFNRMKSSAIFVNAARGPIVNEEALYDALVNGDIAAAGLDVFEKEPIDENHPLLSLKNVVALPHIGSSSVETRMEMMELCVSNIKAVLEGDIPKTLVNKEWQK